MKKTIEERREEYAARKAAKIERFKELAEKHHKASVDRSVVASKMASFIPMGQPIHIGHHSEKGDRAFRKRIDNNIRKSIEHEGAAEHFENRAEKLEESTNIYSDDPDAIEKLGAKVEQLIAHAEFMKMVNAHYRKSKSLEGLKLTDAWKHKIEWTLTHGNPKPFSDWEFSNLRKRIATAKQRAAAIAKADTFEPFEINGIKVDLVDGQIQITFGFKPDEETRQKLKCSPLCMKWSNYSKKWVRKYTGQATYFFTELKKLLETVKEEV